MRDVITFILAGGAGSRLLPFTDSCAKPAVEIVAKYKIIDFMLSNCVNSGLLRIMIAIQYGSYELGIHLDENWSSSPMLQFHVHKVSTQFLQPDVVRYEGTANAVYQNLGIIKSQGDFRTIAILNGDHVLAMDFSQMFTYHRAKQSTFTISVMPVLTAEASRFGVLEVDSDWRVIGFEEKPATPKEIPGRPGWSLVSMGNYFAELDNLSQWLARDAERPETKHDFGKDIIPAMLAAGEQLYAYNYLDNDIPGQTEHCWWDVGTIEALHAANMDQTRFQPKLTLYNKDWPIRSAQDNLPPAKFNQTTSGDFRPINSVVSGGCIIEDSTLICSVLGREVRVYGSVIEESVLFTGVQIGHGCRLHRVMVDKGVHIPPGTSIGYDHTFDNARGLTVDESGIVVVPRGFQF